MNDLEIMTIKCEFITPAFPHGRNINKLELKSSTVKGMMRYWWRKLGEEIEKGKKPVLENELFGDTTRKAKVDIVVHCNINKTNTSENKFLKGCGRSCLVGQAFEVDFRYIKKEEDRIDYLKEYKKAFMILSLFGGLGKRNQKTGGNFRIKGILYKGKEEDVKEELMQLYKECLDNCSHKNFIEQYTIKNKSLTNNDAYNQLINEVAKAYYDIKKEHPQITFNVIFSVNVFNDEVFIAIDGSELVTEKEFFKKYITILNANNKLSKANKVLTKKEYKNGKSIHL